MPYRRTTLLALISVVGLALLIASCTGAGLALRAGLAPALDWRIPTGAYQFLLIHNGPTISCAPLGLRDSCRRQQVRYEFYVHSITPHGDRVLIWFPTHAP